MRFAIDAGAACRSLRPDWQGRRLADQMFRSATSVAANYHVACRARSRREFIAKVGLVVEEADETLFWLEFGVRTGVLSPDQVHALVREARQLVAIFVASAKTAAMNVSPPAPKL